MTKEDNGNEINKVIVKCRIMTRLASKGEAGSLNMRHYAKDLVVSLEKMGYSNTALNNLRRLVSQLLAGEAKAAEWRRFAEAVKQVVMLQG
ncbi:hypothetical protein IJJ27_02070 [bacterium]|nr:hypothetical protein [bacterium]MBQ6436331.1 hypothetical protein [bacterium]